MATKQPYLDGFNAVQEWYSPITDERDAAMFNSMAVFLVSQIETILIDRAKVVRAAKAVGLDPNGVATEKWSDAVAEVMRAFCATSAYAAQMQRLRLYDDTIAQQNALEQVRNDSAAWMDQFKQRADDVMALYAAALEEVGE